MDTAENLSENDIDTVGGATLVDGCFYLFGALVNLSLIASIIVFLCWAVIGISKIVT